MHKKEHYPRWHCQVCNLQLQLQIQLHIHHHIQQHLQKLLHHYPPLQHILLLLLHLHHFCFRKRQNDLRRSKKNWPRNKLNHPHVKSRDNEMGLFVVCLPCTLADGSDKKILLMYPFTLSRWIQHVMSLSQKHHFNVKTLIISSNSRSNRKETHPCYLYSTKQERGQEWEHPRSMRLKLQPKLLILNKLFPLFHLLGIQYVLPLVQ